MNKIYFLFLALLLLNCNESKPSGKSETKIETYLKTTESKYQNYKTNSAVRDELNNFIKKDFISQFNNSILSDLPFQLDRVEKCANGKYILSLEHSLTSKLEDEGMLANLEIDLYCSIDEKKAKELTEGKFYLIDGKFNEYITFQNNEKYCAYVLMSPFVGFTSDLEGNEIQFGSIAFDLKSIKETH